jgi:NAD(P)-dependent dehydrogenase (short-subunit alcohol dehydrogenase family)
VILRDGLLDEVQVAVAGQGWPAAGCPHVVEAVVDDTEGLAAEVPTPDVLVAAAPLDDAFLAARAVANRWIAEGRERGKVVFVAPRDDAPQRAALENLARTLSTEWARFGITPTAILPGPRASDEDVAQLVAFLASPAGDYYSGCAFTLGVAEG